MRRQWSHALRSESPRAERLNRNIKNFELLIGDLEGMPDLIQGNVRLYTITGDAQDPETHFVGNIPNQFPLIASLHAAYDAKSIQLDDSVLGVALAGTAVRHLTFQEYMERDPDMLERVLQRVRDDNEVDMKNFEKFDKVATNMLERYYMAKVVPNLPPPPNMPENMRVRAVVVSVLMKDGLSFLINSNSGRGRKMDLEAIDRDTIAANQDFNMMWQFMHGVRPESTDNPFARVKEFALLKSAFEGSDE